MSENEGQQVDAVVVGAGFAGLYLLYKLRQRGLRVVVLEQADNVGGTWYWNRYPGARCDAESLAYSFSFSEELEQEWEWSERYARQPEILAYAVHVSERFDLRRDIRFLATVTGAHFDDQANLWTTSTDNGDVFTSRFVIMATGCLSVPLIPDIEGLDSFAGDRYQASLWPHEEVDFTGQRVAVIGTGSSAIQAIPVIAEQAKQLTVFQRTPNFSVPAVNSTLDPTWVAEFKRHYQAQRAFHKRGEGQGFGDLAIPPAPKGPAVEAAGQISLEQCHAILEQYWTTGGAQFMGAIGDAMMNEQTNELVAEFVRHKIQQIVKDPATAKALCPDSHPIGTKRICVDINYYETYNRENVRLVNLRDTPITSITANGVQTSTEFVEVDALVLATGFDAMTGALKRIDIRGSNGISLASKWEAGPRTYLGLQIAGFPNLFTVTGPGSPSVLSNMMVSIEQHVDFIDACLSYMADKGKARVEAALEAEDMWVDHVNEVAAGTLFPKAGSWYMGANIPGKPRVFMPYAAGVGVYREVCEDVVANDYRGFVFG